MKRKTKEDYKSREKKKMRKKAEAYINPENEEDTSNKRKETRR